MRCNYHGWLFDESGRCLEQPYEDVANPEAGQGRLPHQGLPGARARRAVVGLPGSAAGARAAGLGALHLAERLSPDRDGRRAVQLVPVPGELDRSGAFRMDARQLEQPRCAATAPIRAEAPQGRVRASSSTASSTSACARARARHDRYWTIGRVCLWPNGFYLGNHFEWRVPVDDENTLQRRLVLHPRAEGARALCAGRASRPGKARSRTPDGRWITSHVMNQDFVAWVGQGAIADRTHENLGSSDVGITMMRQRFFAELEAIARRPRSEGHHPRSRRGAMRSRCPTWGARPIRRASRSRTSARIRCCASS